MAHGGDEDEQPPTMTSARPGSRPGVVVRSSAASVASVRNTSSAAARSSRKWWMRVAVVLGQADARRRRRCDRAGEADERAAPRCAGIVRDDVVEVASDHVERGRQLLGRGGSCAQELLGDAHAADVERDDAPRARSVPTTNSVEPPPMSTTRNGPLGGVEVGGGAEERQPGLLLAREQLGADAEDRLGGVEEVVAVGGVAGRGRGRRSAPASTPWRSMASRYSRRTSTRPLDGLGVEPAGRRRRPRRGG